MKPRLAQLLFFSTAIVAFAVHFFLFEMRYMWHTPNAAFLFWRWGYVACVGLILVIWKYLPSRLLVAFVGFVAMFFPHLYPVGLAAQKGRAFDLPSVGYALVAVALLVGATDLRRRAKAW